LSGLFGVTSYIGGNSFPSFDGSNQTVGWKFTVASNYQLLATHLGFYDRGTDGLYSNHMVGLWALDGTLLINVTVMTNSPLQGDFRYEQLATPVTLTAGTSYILGADFSLPISDVYVASVTDLVMGSGITFAGAARSATASGFAFPGTISASSGGRFGPNVRYEATILS
jgi:hypothetical protein